MTVAFVNPAGRGASVNQAMSSSSPRLYTRRVIGDETLSGTSAVNLCHSEARSAAANAFIVKSFRSRYLTISEAIQDISSGWDERQVHRHRSRHFCDKRVGTCWTAACKLMIERQVPGHETFPLSECPRSPDRFSRPDARPGCRSNSGRGRLRPASCRPGSSDVEHLLRGLS